MEEDDTELYVTLFTKNERKVRRYVQSLLPMERDIDDVMQETATVLWRKFVDYDKEQDFLPWALRFAYFEVLKFRKTKGKSRLVFSEELLEGLTGEYVEHAPVSQFRKAALAKCLGKLPQRDQLILDRRYVSRRTVAELAAEDEVAPKKLYYRLEVIRNSLLGCINRELRKEGFHVE